MNLNEAILILEEKINSFKEYTDAKKEGLSEASIEKIDQLATKTVSVLESVKDKVRETANRVPNDENFQEFLEGVIEKADNAINYTQDKINEVVQFDKPEEKLKDAAKQIKDSFDEIKDNSEVKEMVASIKEVTASIYSQLEDYMSKPETQEVIKKAKKSTIKIAEKGVSALKDLFKVEEDEE